MAQKPIRVYAQGSSNKPATKLRAEAAPADAFDRVPIGQGTASSGIIHQLVPKDATAQQIPEDTSRTKFEELFHSIYDAVLLTDLDGNILDANARAEHCLQRPHERLCRLNILDIIAGADAKLIDFFREKVASNRFTLMEANCKKGDSSVFFSEIVVSRLRGHEQDVQCFFIRDQSTRKQAEEQLQQANEKLVEAEKSKTRLEMLSVLQHRLNNPLQILAGLVEMDRNPLYQEQIERILAALHEMGAAQDELQPTGTGPVSDTTPAPAVVDDEGWKHPNYHRILLADDEEQLCDLFMRALFLSRPDLVVDSAGDGHSAVQLFAQHHHGLVITDVNMPGMNGEQAFTAIENLCAQNRWCMPPFVFCTGFGMSNSLREIIGDGAYHSFVMKPVSFTQLIEEVVRKLPSS